MKVIKLEFESPWDFILRKSIDNIEVEIRNTTEFVQGGPQIGKIFINGNSINNEYYGGPFVLHQKSIYLPRRVRSFWFSGFILTKINLENFTTSDLGVKSALIHILEINEDSIIYNSGKSKSHSLKIG